MKSDAETVEDYLAELPADRRDPVALVCERIRTLTPGVTPTMKHGMPFYERDGDAYIAVASQKQYVSVYVVGLENTLAGDEDIAAAFDGIGRGKGCLRFRPTQLDRLTAECPGSTDPGHPGGLITSRFGWSTHRSPTPRAVFSAVRASWALIAEGCTTVTEAAGTQEPENEADGRLAILVGGGPAPGINSVIGAATIRAELAGVEVVGIRNGFEHLMAGEAVPDAGNVVELTAADVSRIHFRGGSILGTSRANPTKDPALLEQCVASLEALGVTRLITIGGDDTAYSAMRLSELAGDRLHVVHAPKTIDNDLDLPASVDTFGFQTARHVGVEVVKNLMTDAKTTSRWYFVIAMGRKAGHLALGMGKAAGATVTLIPEEFGETVRLSEIVDTLVGAVIKRRSTGRRDGVAVIAEGVVLSLDPGELEDLEDVELDEHGHVRIAEVDIGGVLKDQVQQRLAELDLKTTIVAKDVGYELRCADPIPVDMEYCRDLGYSATKYLVSGGDGVMVTMQAGQFVPVPFGTMLDPETGRTKVRLVDMHSTRYAIARRYMLRVRRDDFEHEDRLAPLAETAGLSIAEFTERFQPLVADEPPELVLDLVDDDPSSS